jgi:hypothetical protein
MLLAAGCHYGPVSRYSATKQRTGKTDKKNAATKVWAAAEMAITVYN